MKFLKYLLLSLLFQISNAYAQNLEGHYDMNITMGSRHLVFLDHMILKAQDGIDMYYFNANVEGSIEVPNSFISPLAGYGFCSFRDSSCRFTFDITAHENGSDYKVHYVGQILPDDYRKIKSGRIQPTIRGKAYLDNGAILGEFVAIKKAEL